MQGLKNPESEEFVASHLLEPKLIIATEKDIPLIAGMAARIWPVHYTPIIGSAQVDYMLKKLYSESSLREQFHKGQNFFLIMNDGKPIGYIAVEGDGKQFFMHKFYMEVEEQGKGYGKKIFNELLKLFPQLNTIELQVNRRNIKTVNFYFRVGFVIKEAKDFDIGGGYFMKDYVMIYRKK
jgi:GNAT superfamily N-acetyltransferase